jgi:hypothetical protein
LIPLPKPNQTVETSLYDNYILNAKKPLYFKDLQVIRHIKSNSGAHCSI